MWVSLPSQGFYSRHHLKVNCESCIYSEVISDLRNYVRITFGNNCKRSKTELKCRQVATKIIYNIQFSSYVRQHEAWEGRSYITIYALDYIGKLYRELGLTYSSLKL